MAIDNTLGIKPNVSMVGMLIGCGSKSEGEPFRRRAVKAWLSDEKSEF